MTADTPAAGSGSPAEPAAPLLVSLLRGWHTRLRQSAPPGVDPLLRLVRGAPLLRDGRGRLADAALGIALSLAGRGLEPPPPGFAGVSLRPKVSVEIQAGGGGLQLTVSYFGRVPGGRALASARDELGDRAWIRIRGGAGRAIHISVLIAEPPRSLPLVLVEAGGRELAIPMNFVTRAEPRHDPRDRSPRPEREPSAAGPPPGQPAAPCAAGAGEPGPAECLARRLGLVPTPSARGRAAHLLIAAGSGSVALRVDAVLGHRTLVVHGVGPLLGLLPWLLGVARGEDGKPILVLHPRRLPRSGAVAGHG